MQAEITSPEAGGARKRQLEGSTGPAAKQPRQGGDGAQGQHAQEQAPAQTNQPTTAACTVPEHAGDDDTAASQVAANAANAVTADGQSNSQAGRPSQAAGTAAGEPAGVPADQTAGTAAQDPAAAAAAVGPARDSAAGAALAQAAAVGGQASDPGLSQARLASSGSGALAAQAPNDTAAIKLVVAVSEDKGSRQVMEDVAVVVLDARPQEQQQAGLPVRCCFLGVFDGHGGRQVAALSAQELHAQVLAAGLTQVLATASATASPGPAAGSGSTTSQQPAARKMDVKACKAAITQGFQATDGLVLQRCAKEGWQDGACAVAAWAVQDTILLANVGDAKAVLARTTEKAVGSVPAGGLRALVLSKDHLAVVERARIQKAGGFVSGDGRLNGRMQVSRSFGDAPLKQCGCISVPDITAFELTARDAFMLLACDGFWSVFEPQGAVDMAASLLAEGRDAKSVTNRLLNEAVRERKCKDNCTVLLARFVRQQQ